MCFSGYLTSRERPRILSYDEIIEGPPKVAFPHDLEFEFEIPSEEMDLLILWSNLLK